METLVRAAKALLMIALPLVLGAVRARRYRLGWGLFGIGAATFLLSQVLHLPFNAWVLTPWMERLGLWGVSTGMPLVLMGILFGLSAGVFEEGARAVVYRTWLRRARTWPEALLFGAGHGGIEAMVLGGLSLYGLLQALALDGVDLATVVPAEQVEAAQAQLQAYWGMPWHLAILGAVERVFALCLHLSLTVLVLQAFRRRNALWWVGAVGWHALVDAGAVVAAVAWGPYLAEGIVGLMALASLGIVFKLRGGDVPDVPAKVEAAPPPVQPTPPAGERKERLDESRYVE